MMLTSIGGSSMRCASALGAVVLSVQEPLFTREFLLPQEYRAAAEVGFTDGRVIVIMRGPTRTPEPDDSLVAILTPGGGARVVRMPGQDIPAARGVRLHDAFIRGNQLAVSLFVIAADNQKQKFILLYDLTGGQLRQTISTSPVECYEVAIDEEQTIWCLGLDATEPRNTFHVLHRYSLDGRVLGKFCRRDQLPAGSAFPFQNTSTSLSSLMVRDRRVFAWLPTLQSFIEWDFSGVRRNLIRMASTIHGAQMPQELVVGVGGRPFTLLPTIAGPDRRLWRRGLFEWTQSRGAWMPHMGLSLLPINLRLAGVESDEIVLWDRTAGRLVWVPI